MQKLMREFYDRDTVEVAKDLLGKFLIREAPFGRQIGRIVEVEAYTGSHDLACHTSKGLTPRTQVMFGPPGYAYVYLIYGLHYCLNVVTENQGKGCAVLLRALEPIQNISTRTQGPGLLCKALSIDKSFNGHDFLSDTLFIADDLTAHNDRPIIVTRPRIGVAYAKEWADKLLRFYLKDNPFVSKR